MFVVVVVVVVVVYYVMAKLFSVSVPWTQLFVKHCGKLCSTVFAVKVNDVMGYCFALATIRFGNHGFVIVERSLAQCAQPLACHCPSVFYLHFDD